MLNRNLSAFVRRISGDFIQLKFWSFKWDSRMLMHIIDWTLSELKRCKGRFRLLKLSLSSRVAGLFSLPAVSDAKKDMSKREMPCSGKGLAVFWNLLESSSSVCPQTFESRPCFISQNPKLACSKFIKFLPSSVFTARAHVSRNTLIFSRFRKEEKKQ